MEVGDSEFFGNRILRNQRTLKIHGTNEAVCAKLNKLFYFKAF